MADFDVTYVTDKLAFREAFSTAILKPSARKTLEIDPMPTPATAEANAIGKSLNSATNRPAFDLQLR
jgi:hypothetical protein